MTLVYVEVTVVTCTSLGLLRHVSPTFCWRTSDVWHHKGHTYSLYTEQGLNWPNAVIIGLPVLGRGTGGGSGPPTPGINPPTPAQIPPPPLPIWPQPIFRQKPPYPDPLTPRAPTSPCPPPRFWLRRVYSKRTLDVIIMSLLRQTNVATSF